jgi:hypothetical protein
VLRDTSPTLARVHGHAPRTRLDKKRLEEEKEGKRDETMLLP